MRSVASSCTSNDSSIGIYCKELILIIALLLFIKMGEYGLVQQCIVALNIYSSMTY